MTPECTYPELVSAARAFEPSFARITWPIDDKTCAVYIASCAAGLVKIGRSMSPTLRVKALSYDPAAWLFLEPSPLVIVRGVPFEVEQILHWMFRAQRYFGEWFVHSGELAEFTNELLRSAVTAPDVASVAVTSLPKPGHELLDAWRREKRLTQWALAELLGVSQAIVSKWLSGSGNPGREVAIAIESASNGFVPVASWNQSRVAA